MKVGASSAPAVMGSMTSASIGMPMIAKPPPNAPFMKVVKYTASIETRMVGRSRLK
jgi:hypothetical protein